MGWDPAPLWVGQTVDGAGWEDDELDLKHLGGLGAGEEQEPGLETSTV